MPLSEEILRDARKKLQDRLAELRAAEAKIVRFDEVQARRARRHEHADAQGNVIYLRGNSKTA
jgi:hypothetical protein